MPEITLTEAKNKAALTFASRLEQVTDLPTPSIPLYNQQFPPDDQDDYWWFLERKNQMELDGENRYLAVHKKTGEVKGYTIR